MAFYGEYRTSFTGNARVVLPKKLRDAIHADRFIVSKGFGTCLHGYAIHDWERRSEELLNVSLLDKEFIDKRRFLFSSATTIEADNQGRFIIPKPLLEYAQLKKEVIFIGAGDHFEIWDPEIWSNYLNSLAI